MLETTALVLYEDSGQFKMEKVLIDDDNLQEEDVLVEITAASICHTDITVAQGKLFPGWYPRVLGHEGTGIVRKVGSTVSKLQPGDRVILSYGRKYEGI